MVVRAVSEHTRVVPRVVPRLDRLSIDTELGQLIITAPLVSLGNGDLSATDIFATGTITATTKLQTNAIATDPTVLDGDLIITAGLVSIAGDIHFATRERKLKYKVPPSCE